MSTLVTAINGHRVRCELVDTGVGVNVWAVRFLNLAQPIGYGQWRYPIITGATLDDALHGATKLALTWEWET